MAGTRIGGLKCRDANISRYGKDYYVEIGRIGGQNGTTGGFADKNTGSDGLTGKQRARIVGRIGGKLSKRGKSIKTV